MQRQTRDKQSEKIDSINIAVAAFTKRYRYIFVTTKSVISECTGVQSSLFGVDIPANVCKMCDSAARYSQLYPGHMVYKILHMLAPK